MILLYACLVVMTLMGSVASLFLKRASSSNGVKEMASNVNLYAGVFLYLGSAALNIWLLRFMDYSVVLPLTSLTYIWTMVLSHMILKEKIGGKKLIGVALILIGAVLVSVR